MSGSVEAVRAIIESPTADLRRAVQSAVTVAAQGGGEQEVLRAVQSLDAPGFRWLAATLCERINGTDAAKPLWESVVDRNGCEIPEVLLHRARILAREGKIESAALLIKIALENSRSYDLFLRAERIAHKCRLGFGLKHRIRVALLSSSTTSLLRSILELHFLRDGFDAEIYEPPYGTYSQELLSEQSGLKAFNPDFIVILLNWRDLGLTFETEREAEADAAAIRIQNLWSAARKLSPRKIIHFTFSAPVYDAALALSSCMANGKTRVIRRVNEKLYGMMEDGVAFIDSERIAQGLPGNWEDTLMWSAAKTYPAAAALPVVGEHIVSLIRADMGLSRKLLILDLDNTVWGGIVGEDGMDGIRLGPPSAIGERYQEFQRYVTELKDRGVLLAVSSKNNLEDVMNVMLKHPCSVLKPSDFVSLKVDWNSKSDNIRQISKDLNLGLDSFVFLDDSPAERNAIRRELPDVKVPEISGEPAESIAALERGLYFQAIGVTDEDRNRAASYFARAREPELINAGGNLEEFLMELNMEIVHGSIDDQTIARATQLINKTNQFNLTTPRYSIAEVRAKAASSNSWCRWYQLKDRFVDHGLIGVLIAEIDKDRWEIDTWLLSCRVIGREVETFMFRDLVESARLLGAKQIVATYKPTDRNQLVSRLLSRLGFTETQNGKIFALDLAAAKLPECKFFREIQTRTC